MKKNVLKVFNVIMMVTLIVSLVSCTKKENNQNNNNQNDGQNEQIQDVGKEDQGNSDNETLISITNKPLYTIAELKAEFDESSSSSEYMFKPFYNMDQKTEFTFHFNSKVDPIKAITVHTDSKCERESSFHVLNTGYHTENGVDVVVDPPTTGVLETSYRLDYQDEEKVWGYAPIYYLCIRYDLDSDEVKELEEPIIIPFTIKQEISSPNAYANVDADGTFSVKWDAIPGAVSYRVYSTYKHAERDVNKTAAEYAYIGDHLILKKEISGDVTEYSGEPPYVSEYGQSYQNGSFGSNAFFVTAVDANGNESHFSRPVSSWLYSSTIPNKVTNDALGIDKAKYYCEEFLDRVMVTSVDGETLISYPISYKKVGNPWSNKCTYEYRIHGTNLWGRVTYYNEDGIFPETHESTFKLKRLEMPIVPQDPVIPTDINTFVDSDYDNSIIDITGSTTYPDSAKVKLDPGNVFVKVDIELARMFTGGVYTVDEEIESYLATDNPKYIVIKSGDTIIVREATPEDATDNKTEVVKSEEKTLEPAKKINNNNFVDEQRKSTIKQVTAADKETVVGTTYPVFAGTPGQKYLALKMINQEKKVSLKAFPAYQDADKLFDDLLYVWYQNPYIMGIDPNACKYDYNNQTLIIEYNIDKATAEKQQEAVWKKSQEIVSQIITNDMTDEQKVLAIWEYIEDNSKYNTEAYENAVNNDIDFYKEYGNSWNTYGILCEGVGVCQSYSYTFNALAHLAGLETVMVTGTMNNGGHAWNAVKLDGKWYMIDVTNNTNAMDGVTNWICNASTDFIKQNGFVLDEGFVSGTDTSEFLNTDNTKDWYYQNNLMPKNVAECAKIWKAHKDEENTILVKYRLGTIEEKKAFWKTFKAEAKKLGVSDDELTSWKVLEFSGILIFQKQ